MSNNRNFDPDRIALAFKALANPNRLRIYLYLAACCPPGTIFSAPPQGCCCAGQASGGLPIAPSTVSYHLKELNRAGLVRMQRRGRHIDCWIDPGMLAELAAAFDFTAPPACDACGPAQEGSS